jgi:hypothetical protein
MQNNKMRALMVSSALLLGTCYAQEESVSELTPVQEVAPVITESAIEPTSLVEAPVIAMPIEPVEPVPVVSEPVQETAAAPASTSEQDEVEIKGIDTVDIAQPKGNWLYKRIWWEKAERLYEKIKQLANEISESRIVFFLKRHELDRAVIDPFYLSLGLEQGGLEEITSYLTAQLEQERAAGQLDEKEQQLLDTISSEKKTLEQLGQGGQRVAKLVNALEDALIKLLEQVNQARSYEQSAWDNFKAINRELSDKRARELYYNMDSYWKNLNNINAYLTDSYTKYYEQLTSKVKEEVDSIQGTIQGLKEKGVDIKMQAQKLRTGCKITDSEQEAQQPQESTGILSTIWGWIKAPFVLIGDTVSGIFGMFGGGNEEVVLARPAAKATQESIDVEAEVQEDQQ